MTAGAVGALNSQLNINSRLFNLNLFSLVSVKFDWRERVSQSDFREQQVHSPQSTAKSYSAVIRSERENISLPIHFLTNRGTSCVWHLMWDIVRQFDRVSQPVRETLCR